MLIIISVGHHPWQEERERERKGRNIKPGRGEIEKMKKPNRPTRVIQEMEEDKRANVTRNDET